MFFLMAADRKKEPMDLIIGRLPQEYITKIQYREEVPHIDNSDPWKAYLVEPTSKCNKTLHSLQLHFVTFCYISELAPSEMPSRDRNYR